MSPFQDYFKLNTKTISAMVVMTIALINVTPLCGFLFDCGCTWIWAGLEEKCNIHDVSALHQCPWCSSSFAGILSVSCSVLAGAWLAFALRIGDHNNQKIDFKNMLIRSTSGLAIFLLVAFFSGWISASVQNYPTFIIS